MDLKIGKLIGVTYRSSNEVDLYCTIIDKSNDNIRLYIINGDWDMTLSDTGVGTVHGAPGGDFDMPNIKISYTGKIPAGLNYNEAIAFMNQQLKRWSILRVWYNLKVDISEQWEKLSKAISAGYNAFCSVYTPGKKDKWDDVPF